MTGITIDLGKDGSLDVIVGDNRQAIRLTSSIPRDPCATCGNQWCCNPAHEEEPDSANADDLGHHECVDRIRYNGAIDGIEAIALAVIREEGRIPSWLSSAIVTAIDAARNNIYG